MYVALWEFEVKPGAEAAFEEAYGPEGTWVRLFRRGSGFVETRLLRDEARSNRYVTLDLWESDEAYRHFREEFAADYAVVDQACEELTAGERLLGGYRAVQ